MPAPPRPLVEALAHRYQIERELGRGGMATVYLAQDLRHDRPVALKVLDPELAHALGPERFLREIRVTARLQHPHILPIHDSGALGGLLWYIMPFVEGESLRQCLERERQLPLEDARRIALEVADALGYAHEHGVVHRDIKPENILLSGHSIASHALVADFGVARAVGQAGGERLTGTGLTLGTPAYMSPEQAAGSRELDGRSDIYSLGCVLYEMLAGEPPFTGSTPQAVIARRFMEPAPLIRRLRATVPVGLEHALARALGREPADRYPNTAEFARAISAVPLASPVESPISPGETTTPVAATPVLPSGRRTPPGLRRAVQVGITALIALGAAASLLLWRSKSTARALDADLLAVAPFDVLDPTLQLWREGLVDLLSRALDGTGPLRTVSPTVIVRRWRGRADRTSALALGRATGAGLAVYGSVIRSANDSVRLSATVLDAARERQLGDLEVRGALTQMDRLTDSLAIGLLRELGRTRPVALVRHSGIAARSLPALRAFLQAEQSYRRGAWDSVRAYGEQAVSLDTTFALAYRRLAAAVGWQGDGTLAAEYAMRAGALNHGLPPRDSLLLAADSIVHTIDASGAPSPRRADRLVGILDQAVQRYPEDPEAWNSLAEVRHHFDVRLVRTGGWRTQLEAFERAIELDPLFVPAYFHPVELSLALGDTARARRYATAAIRLNPKSPQARARDAVLQLSALPDSTSRASVFDSLRDRVLFEAYDAVKWWPDPTELAVQIVRRWGQPYLLGYTLAFRGHVRDALAIGADTALVELVFADAALLGLVPTEWAAREFGAWMRERPLDWCALALPWWAERRDTMSIRRFLHRVDTTARSARSRSLRSSPDRWVDDSVRAAQMTTSAMAHLALMRHDTAAALLLFDSLAASPAPCAPWCQADLLLAARLLAGRGRLNDAARMLNEPPSMEGYSFAPRLSDVLWYLERGRVAERLGDRNRALEAYRYVSAIWRRPDSELEAIPPRRGRGWRGSRRSRANDVGCRVCPVCVGGLTRRTGKIGRPPEPP